MQKALRSAWRLRRAVHEAHRARGLQRRGAQRQRLTGSQPPPPLTPLSSPAAARSKCRAVSPVTWRPCLPAPLFSLSRTTPTLAPRVRIFSRLLPLVVSPTIGPLFFSPLLTATPTGDVRYISELYKLSRDNLIFDHELGRGRFGSVRLVRVAGQN